MCQDLISVVIALSPNLNCTDTLSTTIGVTGVGGESDGNNGFAPFGGPDFTVASVFLKSATVPGVEVCACFEGFTCSAANSIRLDNIVGECTIGTAADGSELNFDKVGFGTECTS